MKNENLISIKNIDDGAKFDFGRTSTDYAKFRDIYPQSFYEKIVSLGLCTNGQKVLDVGTGTGVLPRFMKKYGAEWTGIDISKNQIEEAKRLSKNDNSIQYFVRTAEETGFSPSSFDVITACQCYWYFDFEKTAKEFSRILKPNGKGAIQRPIPIPSEYEKNFKLIAHEEWKLPVHFTRESWNGRMKACRGTGASLSSEKLSQWEKEHLSLLEKIAPKEFDVLHYAAYAEFEKQS